MDNKSDDYIFEIQDFNMPSQIMKTPQFKPNETVNQEFTKKLLDVKKEVKQEIELNQNSTNSTNSTKPKDSTEIDLVNKDNDYDKMNADLKNKLLLN